MNAMIFAAGLGTRLKPLTDTMPKAMVSVCGRPLIQIVTEKLQQAGCNEMVVNVHHFAQQIIDFMTVNHGFGISTRFSDETQQLLETGGGLKKAAALFTTPAPILVHNVDILSNVSLKDFYTHVIRTNGGATTLLVSQRKTQRYLIFDDDNRLVGWTNIATGQIKSPYPELMAHDGEQGYTFPSNLHLYAFSGIQVFSPSLLPLMQSWEGKFSIIDFYLSICHRQPIYCYPKPDLELLDVGKLDTIEQAEHFIQKYN